MAEPASSTAAGVAIAAGALTISGSILGVQYDALLAGFAGGLIALSYLPEMRIPRIAGSVATASLLAGFFAPAIAAGGVNYFPWFGNLGDFARITAAFAIGIGGQVVIPAGLNWIKNKVNQS